MPDWLVESSHPAPAREDWTLVAKIPNKTKTASQMSHRREVRGGPGPETAQTPTCRGGAAEPSPVVVLALGRDHLVRASDPDATAGEYLGCAGTCGFPPLYTLLGMGYKSGMCSREGEEPTVELPEDVVEDVRKRLRRMAGQVQGIERTLAEGRDCLYVVMQLTAVSQAVDTAGFKLVAGGSTYCLSHPERQGR